jgi:hypothetical protein
MSRGAVPTTILVVRPERTIVRHVDDALPMALASGALTVALSSCALVLVARREQAVNQAIPRLVGAGVLKKTTIGLRNRAFEAQDLIDAFNDLERQLAR